MPLSRRGILMGAGLTALGARKADAATRKPASPATFVLVHGAWHGGWCYARVAERLRSQGHRVYTPTLTGVGERSHLASLGIVNCSTHVQDIVSVLKWEQLTNVVLCGHSYGGVVIAGAAEAVPDRIGSLVFLDSVVPRKGEWMLDDAQPQLVFEFLKSFADHAGYLVPPYPASIFNVNEADRPMVDALCTAQPAPTFLERLKLTGSYLSIPRKTYVRTTNWQGTDSLRRTYERLKHDASWTAMELPTGHDLMLDAPDQLAKILLQASART